MKMKNSAGCVSVWQQLHADNMDPRKFDLRHDVYNIWKTCGVSGKPANGQTLESFDGTLSCSPCQVELKYERRF